MIEIIKVKKLNDKNIKEFKEEKEIEILLDLLEKENILTQLFIAKESLETEMNPTQKTFKLYKKVTDKIKLIKRESFKEVSSNNLNKEILNKVFYKELEIKNEDFFNSINLEEALSDNNVSFNSGEKLKEFNKINKKEHLLSDFFD